MVLDNNQMEAEAFSPLLLLGEDPSLLFNTAEHLKVTKYRISSLQNKKNNTPALEEKTGLCYNIIKNSLNRELFKLNRQIK